jgi:hypothetical protein
MNTERANLQRRTNAPQQRREIVVTFLCCVLIGAVALFSRPAATNSAVADEAFRTPAGTVAAMMAAWQADQRDAFLDCFAGPLRADLQDRISVKISRLTLEEPRSVESELTGFATTGWEFAKPDSASVVLERIYRDFNERQRLELQQINGDWRIVAVTDLGQFDPKIPYGTPVSGPQE